MSGVAVLRYLLANDADLLAVIPSTSIRAGTLPLGTVLPAISVTQISSTPSNSIRINEPRKMHTERVQVTALFKDTPNGSAYEDIKNMMWLILFACGNRYGLVNGVQVDSIIPQSEGPDMYDHEHNIHMCSRDFLVRFIGD